MPPTASHRARRAVTGLVVGLGAMLLPAGGLLAQDPPGPDATLAPPPPTTPSSVVPPADGAEATTTGGAATREDGRSWLVPIPVGCTIPALPDVVFVGTLLATGTPAGLEDTTENQTARFRLDQARAGAVDRFTYDGMIDVRYGLDAKDLEVGDAYLVGASVDAGAGALMSKVRQSEPAFGGDDAVAAAQQDLSCPALVDPVRTVHTDGTPVDDDLLKPLLSSKGRLLRAILLPLTAVFAVVFVLAALRWIITGAGRGVASVVRTASEPREVRAAMRSRPNADRDLQDAHRR